MSDPTLAPCPSALSDTPTPLFGGTALIRPPIGVDLVEKGNEEVTMEPQADATCNPVVEDMRVVMLRNDPARPLDDYLADFLAGSGQRRDVPITDRVRSEETLVTELSFPPSESHSAARGLLAFSRERASVFLVYVQASSEDWPALEAMLLDSVNSLLIRPR